MFLKSVQLTELSTCGEYCIAVLWRELNQKITCIYPLICVRCCHSFLCYRICLTRVFCSASPSVYVPFHILSVHLSQFVCVCVCVSVPIQYIEATEGVDLHELWLDHTGCPGQTVLRGEVTKQPGQQHQQGEYRTDGEVENTLRH